MGIDPAYLAVPMIGVLAGAIGNSRVVRLKRSYAEPIVAWTATVAPSGAMKSPPLELVLGPSRERDMELLRTNESARKAFDVSLARRQLDRCIESRRHFRADDN